MQQGSPNIEISWHGQDICQVRLTETRILDEMSIERIGRDLDTLVQENPGAAVVLSFQDVEHLSSSALSMLLVLKKNIEDYRGQLKLSDIRPNIMQVFKITKLSDVFDIVATSDEALTQLQQAKSGS